MDKVFKYYAIAPLTLGNIFSADKNLKLKDFEIIWNGTKYTCDSEDALITSEKNFFTKDQLKKFIKDDTLAEKIIKLFESNVDEKGSLIRNKNLYYETEKSDDRKHKLYIDENINANNLITIDNTSLGEYYIKPLETIKYLIKESLDKREFDSEDKKNLEYNKELLYKVIEFTFNNSFVGLIQSYKIGDDVVNIDECLKIEDVEKIYQGIKNGKTININTIKKTNNFYFINHDIKDENIYKKWGKLKKGIKINPNFWLKLEDLGAYLKNKLEISGDIKFETRNEADDSTNYITIKIPDQYLTDRLKFVFFSKNEKKYVKADICNKADLNYYDFKINPPYEDIAKKLKDVYNLDNPDYTLNYNGKTINKGQKINRNYNSIISVGLEDNDKNKDFLTDKKTKLISLQIIGKNSSIFIYLNDFKNNELLKWFHEYLKIIKKTNDISNFNIKFYKDETAKEEIQIPNDDNNINFEYKEDSFNKIYISISEKEKEKEKDKRNDSTNNEGGTEQGNSTDQGGENGKGKKKCRCC